MFSDGTQNDLFCGHTSSPGSNANIEEIVGFKGRKYKLGDAVRGYRDLNSKDSLLFSIQAKGGPLSGTVLDHGVSVTIVDAVFNVRIGGRDRVRRERRRNVHSFVEGQLESVCKDGKTVLPGEWIEVTYNPFYTDTFIEKATGRPVLSAKKAVLQSGSVFCQLVTFG
jgi:hypothetical protein